MYFSYSFLCMRAVIIQGYVLSNQLSWLFPVDGIAMSHWGKTAFYLTYLTYEHQSKKGQSGSYQLDLIVPSPIHVLKMCPAKAMK